jgi:hypothetical protein
LAGKDLLSETRLLAYWCGDLASGRQSTISPVPVPEATRHRAVSTGAVSQAHDVLQRLGLCAVEGPAVLAAILAHGDIPWRAHNQRAGQPLEVGIDPYSGTRCSNRWRAVLAGEPLLPALPSRYG